MTLGALILVSFFTSRFIKHYLYSERMHLIDQVSAKTYYKIFLFHINAVLLNYFYSSVNPEKKCITVSTKNIAVFNIRNVSYYYDF